MASVHQPLSSAVARKKRFQVCSGIDDVGEAFTRLEAANWNLAEAVNSIFGESSPVASQQEIVALDSPEDVLVSSRLPPNATVITPLTSDSGGSHEGTKDWSAAGGITGAGAAVEDVAGAVGNSSDAVIQVDVQVMMGGLTGQGAFPLEVPIGTTVGELKGTLFHLLGIMPCKQVLCGFSTEVTDSTVITPDVLIHNCTITVDNSGGAASYLMHRRHGSNSSEPEIMEVLEPDVELLPQSNVATTASLYHNSSSLVSLPSTSSNCSISNMPHSSTSSNRTSKTPITSSASCFTSFSNSHSHTSNNSSSNKFALTTPSFSKTNKPSSSNNGSTCTGGSSSSSSARYRGGHVVPRHATILTKPLNATGSVKSDSDDPGDVLEPLYKLHITDLTHDKYYVLPFPGTRTVGDIKQDVYAVTSIPVHRQAWTGWPPGAKDVTTLANSGASISMHLTVCLAPSPPPSAAVKTTPSTSRKGLSRTASNSSSDEFEDAPDLQDDDDTFLEMMDGGEPENKPTALLPASLEGTEEQVCVEHFAAQFTARYGTLTPLFFQGPLREALDQSVMLPPSQRRLLALYAHHDGSVLANVFCSQVLCQSVIISFLADNFVLWGWDITHPPHRDRLVSSLSSHIGPAAGMTVRSFRSEQLPALVLLTRSRGAAVVLEVIYASSTLDEVMTSLMAAVEVFEGGCEEEAAEERQRASRQAIRSDQDAAYQESLRADRAKAELRRQQEEDEQREMLRQESIRLHEQEMTEKLRASLQSELPPEPVDTDSPEVVVMRFRQPGTEQFTRAFTLDTSLQVVLNFLHVRGFPADNFKFLQSWPRRDLASLDVSKTLRHFSLPHQETITIEER